MALFGPRRSQAGVALARSLSIDVKTEPSTRDLDRALAELQEELRDFRKGWRNVAKMVFIPATKRAFASRTSPDGGAWDPLTTEYATRKKREGGSPRRILQLGKDLKRTATRIGKTADGTRIFGKRLMVFGTQLSYSVPLQWGYGAKSFSSRKATGNRKSRSKGKRSDIAARPFMVISSKMSSKATELIIEHIERLTATSAKQLAARRARLAAGSR